MSDKFKVISLGWGVQSFTLAAMVALGRLEPVDYAVHADTGYESSLTYAFAERWTGWLEERGVKVVTLKQQNPIVEYRKSGWYALNIPVYSDKGGQFSRQCTSNWKIFPMRRWLSQELKRHGLKKTEGIVEQWIGISADEFCRAKPSRVKYIKNRFPLIVENIDRKDCKKWLFDNGLEIPPKSSCVFCPFHSKKEWQEVKKVDADWKIAVEVDRMIRSIKHLNNKYLHSSRKPLDEVDMRTQEEMGQMRLL